MFTSNFPLPSRNILAAMLGAGVFLIGAGNASANLILNSEIQITGTGLGAVNTLATVHDPGGPGNQNDTESGCVSWDSATGGTATNFNCLLGLEGGDNTAINNTFLLSDIAGVTTAGELALVVNISETGQDVSVSLTDLYLSFYTASNGTLLGTFSYVGPDLTLTQGSGTGLGGSGFVFTLDAAQQAQANALCPVLADCIAGGGVQFAQFSTNDGNDTLHLIGVESDVVCPPGSTDPLCGPQQVPEPGILWLLAISLLAFGVPALRRHSRSG